MATKTLTPSTDLKNVKPSGMGYEMLDSAPGAFVVLKECNYDDAIRVKSYKHDGSAASRSTAYSRARSLAHDQQDYSGEEASYNIYEETAGESAEANLTIKKIKEVAEFAFHAISTGSTLKASKEHITNHTKIFAGYEKQWVGINRAEVLEAFEQAMNCTCKADFIRRLELLMQSIQIEAIRSKYRNTL
ncbi:TPA: hypothetical protein ACF5HI_004581 [Salmonella enterica]